MTKLKKNHVWAAVIFVGDEGTIEKALLSGAPMRSATRYMKSATKRDGRRRYAEKVQLRINDDIVKEFQPFTRRALRLK